MMATDDQNQQTIQAPSSEIVEVSRTCSNPLVISMTVADYDRNCSPSLARLKKDCNLVALSYFNLL